MDVFLRRLRAVPWGRARQWLVSEAAQRFAAGCVLGLLAACTLTQWRAVWGSSGPFDRGEAAAVIIGLLIGGRCQRRFRGKWPVWLMLASSVCVIGPAWMEFVAGTLKLLSPDAGLTTLSIEAIAAGIALLSLVPAAACWSGLVTAWQDNDSTLYKISLPLCGVAGGLLFVALFGGAAWGLEVTAIGAAACGLAIGLRATWNKSPATTPSLLQAGSESTRAANRGLTIGSQFVCGGAVAVGLHLIRHLIPQTVPLELSTIAVVVLAAAGGLGLALRFSLSRTVAACCFIGLAFTCLMSGYSLELGLHLRLFTAAYFTNPTVNLLSQIALVLAACGPAALVAAMMLGSTRPASLASGAAMLFLGASLGGELLLVLPVEWVITGVAVLLCVLAAAAILQNGGLSMPRRQWLNWTGVAAGLMFLAGMQPKVDSALPAKLLFSTQTFLGYRGGWSVDQLPYLDDARLVAEKEGRQGTLTLWKSRGHDLMLREAGIPRCAISARTAVSPQHPAEVLQTVFPLLVAKEMRNVLLLGASGGMPLSVCLEFPVERVDCVEPDAARLAMIRGPLAAERNYDPLADDRVHVDAQPIELAARMPGGDYDVILASSPLSSLSSGTPQFTEEFYRRVGNKLSADGIFCQRWEGIDYGPAPLQLAAASLTRVFANVIAVEIGVGEFLFLATNSEDGLLPVELPDRLETLHVRRLLARSGWDWSTLLTLPAWDHAALTEFAADGMTARNTAANCRLAFVGPQEVLRWGPKLLDAQALLTKDRTVAPDVAATSRRSRYLDWLGDSIISQDVLRRLSEVVAQTKLIANGPDTCWLDYRKVLREELQQRPRTEIRQVSATSETQRVLHAEDERRKKYFVDLGQAGNLKQRRLEKVYELERYFEPYDPLVSLFARQETAEILKLYGHPDPAAELTLRLHVVYFAPTVDRSLQNVLAAADLLLNHPAALPDPQQRFDTFNGLLQVLRTRWESRSASQVKSVRLAIQDIDRTLIVIESTLAEMDQLATDPNLDSNNWPARRDVLERILVRPLRGYRADLAPLNEKNKLTTEATLLEAKRKK